MLDHYYGARNAVLSEDAGCAEQRRMALGSLAEAVASARVCGCTEAVTELEMFIQDIEATAGSCIELRRKILGFNSTMKDLIDVCHH